MNSIHPGLVETEMGETLLNDFVGLGLFKDRDDADAQMKARFSRRPISACSARPT